MHARPHFVRCLRANSDETPLLFDRATVARQVRGADDGAALELYG